MIEVQLEKERLDEVDREDDRCKEIKDLAKVIDWTGSGRGIRIPQDIVGKKQRYQQDSSRIQGIVVETGRVTRH